MDLVNERDENGNIIKAAPNLLVTWSSDYSESRKCLRFCWLFAQLPLSMFFFNIIKAAPTFDYIENKAIEEEHRKGQLRKQPTEAQARDKVCGRMSNMERYRSRFGMSFRRMTV
jgi:hypothetical protein